MREREKPTSAGELHARAKYLQMRPANDTSTPQQPMVLLPLNQVLEAVSQAVQEAMGASAPRLLKGSQLAERLGCSTSQVDYLRREKGLPFLRVGDSPRYVYDDVVRWLHESKESA